MVHKYLSCAWSVFCGIFLTIIERGNIRFMNDIVKTGLGPKITKITE